MQNDGSLTWDDGERMSNSRDRSIFSPEALDGLVKSLPLVFPRWLDGKCVRYIPGRIKPHFVRLEIRAITSRRREVVREERAPSNLLLTGGKLFY